MDDLLSLIRWVWDNYHVGKLITLVEQSTEELIGRYLSDPSKCFKKDYKPEEEAIQDQQRLVRPILNNLWMYRSLRSILQQFSNKNTEESSNVSDESKSESESDPDPESGFNEEPAPWQKEKRGWTHEEAEMFKAEVEGLRKDKRM
jgi:uncharacterized UBP type Zn finger protein